MLFKYIFIILLLGFSLPVDAQNLVPNPSFEEMRNLPVKRNPKRHFSYEIKSGYIPYIKNLKYWFAGSQTTPDLRIYNQAGYNECKRKFKLCDKAHSGENCVGMMTYMVNDKHDTYREYVQIKLKKKLKPKVKTYVEFWVEKEREAKLVSNNLGCYFSIKKVYSNTKENIEVKPQINFDTIINEQEKKWVKLEAVFYPEQKFEYLVIGNFFGNDETEIFEFKNFNGSGYTPPYAYYLLDDIRVWQEGDVAEKPLVFESKPIIKNEPIQLKNIEFEFNSDVLKTSSFAELEKLLSFLNNNQNVQIKIQGHTDNKGNEAYNQSLSNSRAQAVKEYLIGHGISEHRLTYEGFGESVPLQSNESEMGRSKNRRVEFVVME